MSDAQPIVSARNVKRTFTMGGSPIHVLKDANLDIKPGEFVAIEGRSGSGKSTLLHLLGALDAPTGGSIHYNDTDIAKFTSSERARLRRRDFGFVFQFYHLLPEFDVMQNTLLPAMTEYGSFAYLARRLTLRHRAAELLNQFGLGHRMFHKVSKLSGGERQRVAIARALMNEPKVLYADEPTGNLDESTGKQIMEVLEDLHCQQGQTIVMVTHDRAIAATADRTLLLERGILTQG